MITDTTDVRDSSVTGETDSRQREIAGRLLLSALREQDTARQAVEASHRCTFLSSVGRELALSLDQDATREVVQRRVLPRPGTWCMLDLVELDGAVNRRAVVHPDQTKQGLASTLADHWFPRSDDPIGAPCATRPAAGPPQVITHDSGVALLEAARGPQKLATLDALGFAALLVVPLVVRSRVLGAITFVTREGDPPLSPDEIILASGVADVCAIALDNARLYHETNRLREIADTANRAKSEFLGNMSHELRTPLNAIGGYAQLLEMGVRGAVNAEQRADLKRIKHAQEHLLMLISDILNFVRAEGGHIEYHPAEISVRAALTNVAELLDGAIKDRGLTLDQPGDLDAAAWADPDRVRQILMNLVMNAVKYTPSGGGAITLRVTATRDTVTVQVIDRGPGMPPDQLEAIFAPFVQLAGGLTDRQGGVGLGLAISREMARAMNGNLTVESTLGVGSTFSLILPAPPDRIG